MVAMLLTRRLEDGVSVGGLVGGGGGGAQRRVLHTSEVHLHLPQFVDVLAPPPGIRNTDRAALPKVLLLHKSDGSLSS